MFQNVASSLGLRAPLTALAATLALCAASPAYAQGEKGAAKPKTSTTKLTSASKEPAREAEPPAAEKAAPAPEDNQEKGSFSVAPLIGIGFNSTKIKDNGVETKDFGTLGPGFGLRGGYTLPMKLYVGGTFVYHVGETKDENGVKLEGSVFYVGPEVGYDLRVGPALIRPYAGFGLASAKLKATAGNSSIEASGSKLGLWPGAFAAYTFDKYFVGADMRYLVVTGVDKEASASGFSMFATAGLSL